jgi:hypothetical protein
MTTNAREVAFRSILDPSSGFGMLRLFAIFSAGFQTNKLMGGGLCKSGQLLTGCGCISPDPANTSGCVKLKPSCPVKFEYQHLTTSCVLIDLLIVQDNTQE